MKRFACVLLLAFAGCKSPDQNAAVLATLQQGKAKGHLTITSDGRLSGGWNTQFGFGPEKSALAFDGNIDFGDDVRHVTLTPGGDVFVPAMPHDGTPTDATAPNADDE